jgi:hypothetical protein
MKFINFPEKRTVLIRKLLRVNHDQKIHRLGEAIVKDRRSLKNLVVF